MDIDNYYDAVKAYEDMLDDVYGTVSVTGMEYETSRALRELDPVAFRCGFVDWCDGEGLDTDAFTDPHNAPD